MASLWNRLISPMKTPSKDTNKKKLQQTPQQLLEELKTNWLYIHKIFFIENARENILVSQTEIPLRLTQIVETLAKEDRLMQTTPTRNLIDAIDVLVLISSSINSTDTVTGYCMEYFLNNHVMQSLYDHASADFPRGMLLEVTKTFGHFVNELDSKFLVQSGVHLPILKLLKRGLLGNNPDGEALDMELAQLMFSMCSKLHERPELLLIFFCERRPSKPGQQHTEPSETFTNGSSSPSGFDLHGLDPEIDLEKHEFPLFLYLLHFISHTGKTGDVARAALIICLEISNAPVNEFIIERSNFCRSIVSLVGSLYSDLPSNPSSNLAEIESSPQFKSFKEILKYCQQAMTKAHPSVQKALADEFRNSFLDRFVKPQLFSANQSDSLTELWTVYTELSLREIEHPLLTWAYSDLLLHDSIISFDEDAPVPLLLQRLDSNSPSVASASWRLLYTIVALRPSPATLRLFPSVIYLAKLEQQQQQALDAQLKVVLDQSPKNGGILCALAHRYISLLPFEDVDVITSGYADYHVEAEVSFEYSSFVLKYLQDIYPGVDLFARGQPESLLPSSPLPLPTAAVPHQQQSNSMGIQADDDLDLLGLDMDTPLTPLVAETPTIVPEVVVKAKTPRADPFKWILLRHLSSLLSAPEQHNLLVTGVVTSLAIFPHSILFERLFNLPPGETSPLHMTLQQLSRSITRSVTNRDTTVNSSPRSGGSKSVNENEFAQNLVFFEEFIKELSAALQVQELDGQNDINYINS